MSFLQQILILSLLIPLQVHSQNNNCPDNCNEVTGNGKCSINQKECLCYDDYFGTDCSIKIPQLQDGIPKTLSISPGSSGYFYLPLDDIPGNAVFILHSSQATLSYYFLFGKAPEYSLPNKQNAGSLGGVRRDQTDQIVTIKNSILRLSKASWLLIGAENTDTKNTVTLTITNTWSLTNAFSESESTNNLVLIVSVTIAASAFLIVCFVGAYTWRKKKLIQEQIQLQNYRQRQVQNQLPQVPESPQPLNSNFLTEGELDQYFSIQAFQEIQKSFDHNCCPICLDEYQLDTPCRQLYCEHIFHSKCIEEWLAQNNECPNCKSEITKKAIEEFIQKGGRRETSVVIDIPSENRESLPTEAAESQYK